MGSSKALGKIIKSYVESHNMKRREFARQVGLSHTYLNKLIKGVNDYGQPIDPSVDTLKKLAAGMSIPLCDLLVRTGLMKEDDVDRYIYGKELERLLPEEYYQLLEGKDLEYIKVAANMKKENISPEKIQQIMELITGFDKK